MKGGKYATSLKVNNFFPSFMAPAAKHVSKCPADRGKELPTFPVKLGNLLGKVEPHQCPGLRMGR